MKYELLDPVVLVRDLPQHGLRAGNLGTIVEVYSPDAFEVEFVTASGHTKALLTLTPSDFRPRTGGDALAI